MKNLNISKKITEEESDVFTDCDSQILAAKATLNVAIDNHQNITIEINRKLKKNWDSIAESMKVDLAELQKKGYMLHIFKEKEGTIAKIVKVPKQKPGMVK